MQLSEKIIFLRKRKGMSQEQLANELDVSRQAIYKWETGSTTPDTEKVIKLSEIFGISFDDLLNDNINITETPITITTINDVPEQPTDSISASPKENKRALIAVLSVCLGVTIALLGVMIAIYFISGRNEHTHEFSSFEIISQATCTKSGVEIIKCECGETQTKSTPILPHTESAFEGYEATCSKTGLTDGIICSKCSKILTSQKIIPIDNENHVPKVISGKEATCTETGLTEGTKCTECNKILQGQEEISLAEHTEEILEAREATCLVDGLTEGKRCANCKIILVEQKIIKSNGGHLRKTIEGYEPTCIEKGLSNKVICTECGEALVEAEELDVVPHNYVDGNCTICKMPEIWTKELTFYLNEDKESYRVCSGDTWHWDFENKIVIIPSYYNGLPVTKIGYFEDSSAKKFFIPSTITDIEAVSFKKSSNLKLFNASSVDLERTYNSIVSLTADVEIKYQDDFVFATMQGENYLIDYLGTETDITLPASYDSNPYELYHFAFFNSHITSIKIPSGITVVAMAAFSKCDKLERVELPSTITTIEQGAFNNCTALKSFYIPNSVTYVGMYAFVEADSLVKILIQNGADISQWDKLWKTSFDSYEISFEHEVEWVDSWNEALLST